MALAHKEDRWRRAVDLASNGRVEEAHEIFSVLSEEDPSDSGVWRWLANVTSHQEARIGHLEKALALNTEDSSTRGELHQALVRLGVNEAQHQRLEVARASFERACEVLPDDELAVLWLVEVCDSVHDRIELLERLFELKPRDESIRGSLAADLVRLGEAALDEGEKKLAHSHFRRANKMDGGNLDALFRIAEDESLSLGKRLELLGTVIAKKRDHEAAQQLWDQLAACAVNESSTLPIKACPLCRAPKEPTTIECSACGGLLSFFDLEKLLSNERADAAKLGREVQRLERLTAESDNWRLHKNLLLARLNLGQKSRAAQEINRLLELIPLNEPDRLEIEQARLFLLRSCSAEEKAAVDLEAPPLDGISLDDNGEPRKAPYVLVVDDSEAVSSLIGATLEGGDYEVGFAGTGMEALASIRQATPDLVLLDIGLPNMDGFQLCQLVRQNPATAKVPVIMLSARDGFYDQVRGRMVGCQDFIIKPFDPDDLLDRIGGLIP